MPVQNCTRDGKPGYRAVSPHGEGDCFIYRAGDPGGRERAEVLAQRQLVAMSSQLGAETIRAVIESITDVELPV